MFFFFTFYISISLASSFSYFLFPFSSLLYSFKKTIRYLKYCLHSSKIMFSELVHKLKYGLGFCLGWCGVESDGAGLGRSDLAAASRHVQTAHIYHIWARFGSDNPDIWAWHGGVVGRPFCDRVIRPYVYQGFKGFCCTHALRALK